MDTASYLVANPDDVSGSSAVGTVAGKAQSLPPDGEITPGDAVFLRLLDVTDDPQIRGLLRRILAVPR